MEDLGLVDFEESFLFISYSNSLLEIIYPKTLCFSSKSDCSERQMKNWLLLVHGPELAILKTPALCFNLGLNSS